MAQPALRLETNVPGHGRPMHLPAEAMHASLEKCVAWMKTK